VYAEFLLDGVMRGDFEQRADAYQKSINSGWQTPAEIRKLENLPFIEGSNRLFINSTMVPLDVQTVAPAAIDQETMRTVMGRLSRQKTIDEVDIADVVFGLNGASAIVTKTLEAAKAGGGISMNALRDQIRALAS
jgi:hypothetical protein